MARAPLFRPEDRRSAVRRASRLGAQVASLGRLPPRVAWFWVRALRDARSAGDGWSVDVACRPIELRALLDAFAGARRVAEVGTGAAWTTCALALADPGRRVESWDVEAHPQRDRALALAGPAARQRIVLHERRGGTGPTAPPAVDAVFIDSSHEREETMETFRIWAPVLATGGVVAFHDWRDPSYPGVTEAIEALGLEGETRGRLFIWRKR